MKESDFSRKSRSIILPAVYISSDMVASDAAALAADRLVVDYGSVQIYQIDVHNYRSTTIMPLATLGLCALNLSNWLSCLRVELCLCSHPT